MRALFFGSPAFAVPCLEALHELAEVVCVFSQPDRPAGRGLALKAPAVKVRSLELGLPVQQPTKVRTAAFAEKLRSYDADVAVVVAYGRILPRTVLEAPRRGCVNVHASLLPRWRGAAPIQWAIAAGDDETGVTLMQMDEGMDTGPILATRRVSITPDETTPQLAERLATLGAQLLQDELPRWVRGELEPTPQPAEGVTMARLLTKEDGRLPWSSTARTVHDRVRAMQPWPGTFTDVLGEDRRIKIHATHVVNEGGKHGAPGEVLGGGSDGLRVACGEGVVALDVLQDPNRRRLDADAYLRGPGLTVGACLR